MSVFCLGADEIDKHWNDFKDHLYRLERDDLGDVDEIRADLKAERKQLFGYQDGGRIVGVAITRITKTGVCEITHAVGTQSAPDQIIAVHDAIARWAKSIHCTKLRLQGRRGWLRKLDGYAQVGVIAEKVL